MLFNHTRHSDHVCAGQLIKLRVCVLNPVMAFGFDLLNRLNTTELKMW